MRRMPLESLGTMVRNRRGDSTLRDVAKDIGVSPPTLLRVESGRIPDIATFGKLCKWLELDPGEFLGTKVTGSNPAGSQPIIMTAHFRADQHPTPETIAALSQMLLQVARSQKKARTTDPDEHP